MVNINFKSNIQVLHSEESHAHIILMAYFYNPENRLNWTLTESWNTCKYSLPNLEEDVRGIYVMKYVEYLSWIKILKVPVKYESTATIDKHLV